MAGADDSGLAAFHSDTGAAESLGIGRGELDVCEEPEGIELGLGPPSRRPGPFQESVFAFLAEVDCWLSLLVAEALNCVFFLSAPLGLAITLEGIGGNVTVEDEVDVMEERAMTVHFMNQCAAQLGLFAALSSIVVAA